MITHTKKWEKKCFQRTPGGLYYCKLQYIGRRGNFCTKTPVKADAGIVAKTIYMELRTLGWAATLAKRVPQSEQQAVETVGDLCRKAEAAFLGQRRTVGDYTSAFRRVVADIFGIERDGQKFNYVTGGRNVWLAKVDQIKLCKITRESVEKWRVDYLNRTQGDLERLRSARTTCNSILRACKTLFGPERLEKLGLADIQNPFTKVKLDPAQDVRYRGGVDALALVRAAVAELAPEPFKAFLLSIGAGLRRNEMDKLEWPAFDFEAGTVHVGPTKYLHPKSEKSIGTVDLDLEILAFFSGWYAQRSSDFVLESHIVPKLGTRYPRYRCERTFAELAAWLRKHGLKSRCPIHELRKLFGSRVHEAHGLVAASQSLRHASIGITASHYLSRRPKTTAGLGPLLEG